MTDESVFADLGAARRVWAVSAVHAEVDRLKALQRDLAARLLVGDRIVYLGNVVGRGPALFETVNAVLAFRRAVIGARGMLHTDVVYLRGAQEEMLQKLLQLQFAPNPGEVLGWMLEHGVDAAVAAYGADPEAGLRAVREGTLALQRWTGELRAAVNAAPGHRALLTALKRAAYTTPREEGVDNGGPRLLFVHAGIDVTRPLSAQSDSFWWATGTFRDIAEPYADFARVVRGFDRRHAGVVEGPATLSVDAGCGYGGPLVAVCLDPAGAIVDRLEA